jgi:tRNA nucleotidyltransferase (CCA-adding enzyme)
MFTLGTYFEELLKNIRPSQERLDAARNLPPLIRDYLRDHQEFVTLAPHSRLVGSYAQGLSAGDVKDVDFLIRVNGIPDQNKPEAKQLIKDLKRVLDPTLSTLSR